MLVGGVIWSLVVDQLHIPLVDVGNERLEVIDHAEHGVDTGG
jgi:hypothetical protein